MAQKIELGTGTILIGDCLKLMQELPDGMFRCCITSPPYWGLRKYKGVAKNKGLGNEPTIHEYVENLVSACQQMRRVLADDGTLWLNIGDTFAASGNKDPKPKNLIGAPWRVALALQNDGWWLRSEIIWHKRAGKPESAGTYGHSGRATRVHEHLFLLTKSPRYYYDMDASLEPSADGQGKNRRSVWEIPQGRSYKGIHTAVFPPGLVEPCVSMGSSECGKCPSCGQPWIRIVQRGKSAYAKLKEQHGVDWSDMQAESKRRGVALKGGGATTTGGTRTATGAAAHLDRATRRTLRWEPTCDCGEDPVPDTVLDPFFGSGTVGSVCEQLGREWCGIEIGRRYARLASQRILHDRRLRAEVHS